MQTATPSPGLATLLGAWRIQLQIWASSGALITAALEALQLSQAPVALLELAAQLTAGNTAALPAVELLPAEAMGAALGAYAASNGTIYLNATWLATADEHVVQAVLTEELGHHLDALLNLADTPGDEGALFAARLLGQVLTAEQLAALQTEDDWRVATPTFIGNGNGVTGSITSSTPGIFQEGVTLAAGTITGDPDGNGTIIGYQWYKDNSPIANSNSATLETSAVGHGVYKLSITYIDGAASTATVFSQEQVVEKINNGAYALLWADSALYVGSSVAMNSADLWWLQSRYNFDHHWYYMGRDPVIYDPDNSDEFHPYYTNPAYAYTWEQSSDNGISWLPVNNFEQLDSNGNYTISSADTGKRFRYVVTYVDEQGYQEEIISNPTPPVPDQTPFNSLVWNVDSFNPIGNVRAVFDRESGVLYVVEFSYWDGWGPRDWSLTGRNIMTGEIVSSFAIQDGGDRIHRLSNGDWLIAGNTKAPPYNGPTFIERRNSNGSILWKITGVGSKYNASDVIISSDDQFAYAPYWEGGHMQKLILKMEPFWDQPQQSQTEVLATLYLEAMEVSC